jgi:hypothetical protein
MLLPFGQFQTIVPLAAWLAPIFLLRFSRTQRALIALPVLALVHYLAAVVSMRGGLIPGETLAFYALGGALGVLPYVADTALVRRVPGWGPHTRLPSSGRGAGLGVRVDFMGHTRLARLQPVWLRVADPIGIRHRHLGHRLPDHVARARDERGLGTRIPVGHAAFERYSIDGRAADGAGARRGPAGLLQSDRSNGASGGARR